jgi:hypothetical protein
MQIVHLLAQEALAFGELVAVGLGVEVDVGLQRARVLRAAAAARRRRSSGSSA